MIQLVGLLITAYCLARLLAQMVRQEEPLAGRIFCLVGALLVGFFGVLILTFRSTVPSP